MKIYKKLAVYLVLAVAFAFRRRRRQLQHFSNSNTNAVSANISGSALDRQPGPAHHGGFEQVAVFRQMI